MYFLAAVENKIKKFQNLNCGEKAKAQALINSLEPAILRTRVADFNEKTVRAVLKHITASMAYLEIYHEVHTELNPKVNTHNKHAKQHIQPTKAPEVIPIASTPDGYRANNVKFDNISCRNCRNKGHYASWCTEICGRCTPPCGLLAEECTKAIAIAKAEKAEYDSKRQTKVNNNKQININSSSNNNTKPTHPLFLYDSGANMNCINDNTLMNNTSNPVPSTITTADNTSISVKQGGFFDHPCLYTPSFNNNLVTHDFLTNNNNNIILIYNNTLHITPINEYNKEYIEKISSDSSGTKINTNNDNLFFLTYNDLEQIFNTNRAVSSAIFSTPAISTSISPDITPIRTPILPIISINNVFYKTVELTNIERIVQFWHEALGHPDKRTMVAIVRGGLLKNLPAELTIGAINKHFPLCTACSIANLSTRNGGQPIEPEERRVIATGAEWEIDCKRYSGSTVSPSPSVGGNHFAITAICRHTGYTITSTQASMKDILQFIKSIFTESHLYV